MAVKLRLQRHGRKGYPFYHIVAADARSPRDGRFIQRVGYYNPNTTPATVDVDSALALKWLEDGAQPTPTVKSILSHTGILMEKHLQRGVKKGAINEETAQKTLDKWKGEKSKGKVPFQIKASKSTQK